MTKDGAQTFVIVGDCHMPWAHTESLVKIYDIIEKLKPNYVIQIGDLYDFYSFSKFSKDPDFISPKQELLEGREMAERFWKNIQKRSPKSRCHQLWGNHSSRLVKRIFEKFPEIISLVDVNKLLNFDGVKTQSAEREELQIGELIFMHGYRSRLGDHARYNLASTICGHSHQGGVVFFEHRGKTLFELNCGYAADPSALPLSYGRQKISKWTRGVGIIDALGPRFCPFT